MGLAVTFGTARRGLGGLRPRPIPSSLYQIYQPTHQRPVYKLHIIRCGTVIMSLDSKGLTGKRTTVLVCGNRNYVFQPAVQITTSLAPLALSIFATQNSEHIERCCHAAARTSLRYKMQTVPVLVGRRSVPTGVAFSSIWPGI